MQRAGKAGTEILTPAQAEVIAQENRVSAAWKDGWREGWEAAIEHVQALMGDK